MFLTGSNDTIRLTIDAVKRRGFEAKAEGLGSAPWNRHKRGFPARGSLIVIPTMRHSTVTKLLSKWPGL